MNPLTQAILKSGAIQPGDLDEFRRWGLPNADLPTDTRVVQTKEEAIALLERALQSLDLVLVRLTDLDILKQFLDTQKIGKLHVTADEVSADFDAVYGRTTIGEYVFPWRSEFVEEVFSEGDAYLIDADGKEVHFIDTRVCFFDDQKAFLVCTEAPT